MPEHSEPARRPGRALLAALVVLAVACATMLTARIYAQAMLPFYAFVIDSAGAGLDVTRLGLERPGSEWLIRAELVNPGLIDVGGRLWAPGELALTSSTLAAHSAQHLLFFLSVALAGALYRPVAAGPFAAALACGWLLIETIDIPLVLLGTAWDLIYASYAPERLDDSLLLAWMRFMTDGGRIGLSLVGGWLAVLAGRRRPRVRRPAAGRAARQAE